MESPKRKMWTSEEEAALLAGIRKHGAGKWKSILSDEEFAPHLANRSNVDLKDKWRNLCCNVSSSAWPAPESSPDHDYKETGSWYHAMIFEALSSAENPDGIDIDSIHSYIEQKSADKLPEIFSSYLTSKLGRLVTYGKIERNGNFYKIKDDGPAVDHENNSHGKWKTILTDDEFAPRLANRFNVDLKDKWRNLRSNVSSSAWPAAQNSPDHDSKETAAWYHAIILEALSSAENPDGIDIDSIYSYIEKKCDEKLPELLGTYLTSKLGRLVRYGKIERNGNLYKIKEEEPVDHDNNSHEKIEVNNNGETPEDLAEYAAYLVAVAEDEKRKAIKACKEAEHIQKLLEESMAMLKFVEEASAIAKRDGFVLLDCTSRRVVESSSVSSNDYDHIQKED